MNLPLTTPPSWAYDYCYFFYFLAAIQFFAGAYAISKIIVKNPTVAAILALSIVINCLTTLMLFWMCRGSLRREYFTTNVMGCSAPKRMVNGQCV